MLVLHPQVQGHQSQGHGVVERLFGLHLVQRGLAQAEWGTFRVRRIRENVMATTVTQMTTDELKELISTIIEEKLVELFGDPFPSTLRSRSASALSECVDTEGPGRLRYRVIDTAGR